MGLRIAIVALSTIGCSTVTAIDVGPTFAFASRPTGAPGSEPQVGAQAEARAGVGWSNRDALKTWGIEAASKAKVTAATQNVAGGTGFYLARSTSSGDMTAIVRGGLHLVLERYEETVLVGAGPYGAMAIGVPIAMRDYQLGGVFTTSTRRERTLFTIGPAFELDARFSRPSTVTFFGIGVGIAWTDDNLMVQPNLPRLRPNDPANTPPPY